MSNVNKVLEQLKQGPQTSTQVADAIQMDRSSAKVALLALLKKQLVKREKTDRVGKGPKQAYTYQLCESTSETT